VTTRNGPPGEVGPRLRSGGTDTTHNNSSIESTVPADDYRLASRQVSAFDVYELLSPLLGEPSLIPGTPVWCQLPDTDPAKWSAVLWAAVWWSVAEDARQAELADASTEISRAENWSAVAWSNLQRTNAIRTGAYIERKVS
jgi:hypothetical protein